MRTLPLVTKLFVLLTVAVAAVQCQRTVPSALVALQEPVEPSRSRASYVAEGRRGMVAAAHPLASEAGLAMLKAGGNAIDAAVAASFVISVVRPQSTGIGGGGFMLVHTGRSRATEVLDFRERAPLAATRDMYLDKSGAPKSFRYQGKDLDSASLNGHLAAGVPGLVAGLVEVHGRQGRLPLRTVMAPAIKAAAEGFAVYPGLAEALTERRDVLAAFPASRKVFFKGDQPLAAGDRLIQADLARTLTLIAERGRDGFYKGPVAEALVREMKAGGGIISQADLDQYRVRRLKPVEGTYRGHRVVSMPPPSSGGAHIVQILNMLEGDRYGALGFHSTAGIHLLAESMRRAFADRAEHLGDPDFWSVPLTWLTSRDYAQRLRRGIDMAKATASAAVKPGAPAVSESSSTTHISVVDGEGNAVATTQTINYTFGSCVVAEGTGVVLNNEMDDFSIKPGVANVFGLVGNEANAIVPGKTMLSSMSPTMVFRPDGSLRLVAGSPGGPRIITATLQTVINTIDHGMTPVEAVHAPRIHHQWYPDELRVEKGALSRARIDELTAMGHKVVEKGPIGDVQAVFVNDGLLTGVSDARSEGMPAGF